jgi:hypothetical protein
MRNLIILESFFLLLIVSCQKEMNNNSFIFNQTFDIKCGEIKNNTDYDINISLDSVLNDSRCPSNGLCPWAGNAEVRFVYSKSNNRVSFVLNTLPSFRTDTLINGYRIKLINLTPYPIIAGSIKQSEYKAEIEIIKE